MAARAARARVDAARHSHASDVERLTGAFESLVAQVGQYHEGLDAVLGGNVARNAAEGRGGR